MTVRFLTSWNGYSAGDRATLSAANELALISGGLARADYVQDNPSPLYPPNANEAAAVVGAAGPDARALPRQDLGAPRVLANLADEFTSVSGVTRSVVAGAGWNGRRGVRIDVSAGSPRQLIRPNYADAAMWLGDADTVNLRFYAEGLTTVESITVRLDGSTAQTNTYAIRAYVFNGWNHVRLRLDTAFYWPASFGAQLGDIITPTFARLNGYCYICTTAGTTSGTEPASWPTTLGSTVSDGTAVWTCHATDIRYRSLSGGQNIAEMGGTGTRLKTASIRHMRFDFSSGLAGKSVIFDELLTVDGAERPRFVLTFDNWTGQHIRWILPELNKRRIKTGVCFQNAALPGAPFEVLNYVPNLQRYYDDGHDIVPNDVEERPLAGLSYDVQLDGMTRNIATMRSLGWTRGTEYWALNSLSHDNNTILAAQAAGLKVLRGALAGTQTFAYEGAPLSVAGCVNMDNKFSGYLKDYVDRMIDEGGTHNVLFHKFISKEYARWFTGIAVNAGETVMQYRTRTGAGSMNAAADALSTWVEDFVEFLDYLNDRVVAGEIDVLSPSEFAKTVSFTPATKFTVPQIGTGAF